MKKIIFLPVILFTVSVVSAQFKNDNVLYKTVFPQELCAELQQQKSYVLLDVRSKGEFEDTSSSPGYNLGHLKNAVNINVQELGEKISQLSNHKNDPIYVYCSHSQRSRNASKMLVDSGFTNVINVNGGVTAIRQLPEENCSRSYLETKVGYNIISATGLCKKTGNKDLLLLDIRSDSAFQRISPDAKTNSFGQFKNSLHIPFTQLEGRLSEVLPDKDIVIVDLYGNEAARAAAMLVNNKYKRVSMLLEGMGRLYSTDSKDLACLENSYTSPVKYKIVASPDFRRFIEKNQPYLALDVRSKEEFENKHKDYWKNIGHLQNAVNILPGELAGKIAEIEKYKDRPVFIYAFSGNKESYEAANILIEKGFTNVNILAGGLFNLRWTAFNVAGNTSLSKLIVDIPAENL